MKKFLQHLLFLGCIGLFLGGIEKASAASKPLLAFSHPLDMHARGDDLEKMEKEKKEKEIREKCKKCEEERKERERKEKENREKK